MTRHYIVGAGGIGCWLTPLLKKMVPSTEGIIPIDGDKLEKRNFDRQQHDILHLGWNKAESLYDTYGLREFIPRYLTRLTRPPATENDWVWCCVDNHAARAECLSWIDDVKMQGVFGANEYKDGHGYIYMEAWKGLELDPRVRFPEILTDKTGDPTHPSCQGEAQEAHPQLALYNYLAAGMMVHLYQCWLQLPDELSPGFQPIEHQSNEFRFQTLNAFDYAKLYPIHITGDPVAGGEVDRPAAPNI